MAWIRNRPLGLVHFDPEKSFEGYTLFCTVRGKFATLLDWRGAIVHRWYHPEGIQHAHLLPNGNLFMQTRPPKDAGGAERIGGSAAALLELNWNGDVVWEYRDPLMHHAYYRLPNDETLVMKWAKVPPEVAATVKGGHIDPEDPDFMWGDVIHRIDRAGNVLQEWRSWEHFDVDEDVICPLESHKEWTHANAIDVHADGRWMVSFRLTSTVGIIDPTTGDFTWKWGRGELSHQHAAHWLPNDNILIFDNGCHRQRGPSFSRALEVTPEKEIAWTYTAPVILGFYSFMGGGADRMPNGNTFITECATGRLFEVTPERETVWEWVSGFEEVSRFGATPAIHHARRYAPDAPEVAGGHSYFDAAKYTDLNASLAAGRLVDPALV